MIQDWRNLASPGRFYAQSRVSDSNIRTLELTLFTKQDVAEYIEENKRIIPEQLAGQGYTPWLDSASLQAIIENKIDADEAANLEQMIEAIFYYLEKDTFMHE